MIQCYSLDTLERFSSYTRHQITLRAGTAQYHSIIVFRLTASDANSLENEPVPEPGLTKDGRDFMQMYAMEAQCPHLGADMSYAEIEEYEDDNEEEEMSVVAVCPWHRYDFDLRTGKSQTGLETCVYAIEIRFTAPQKGGGKLSNAHVWMQTPPCDPDLHWEVVEIRPVSEDFAESAAAAAPTAEQPTRNEDDEPVVPENPPKSLIEWAILILNTPSAKLKVARTRFAVKQFQTGELRSIGRKRGPELLPPETPPRETGIVIVDPTKVAKRGKGGSLRSRITMLHALANIEQWAIDLAWDIIARFGGENTLPHQFYTDFARVALDEAKHFSLLSNRLDELGTPYGSLPIHSALWDSAKATADSLIARLAIIHLVHEARGLDVNPATIEKFAKAQDTESVAILKIIHADEITHVAAGHRWFSERCAREKLEPISTFREEVRRRFISGLKGPFNAEDREKAGLTREYYEEQGALVDVRYE